MYDKLMHKVYDSLYAPGPFVKLGAFAVGGYIGLAVVSVFHHRLMKN